MHILLVGTHRPRRHRTRDLQERAISENARLLAGAARVTLLVRDDKSADDTPSRTDAPGLRFYRLSLADPAFARGRPEAAAFDDEAARPVHWSLAVAAAIAAIHRDDPIDIIEAADCGASLYIHHLDRLTDPESTPAIPTVVRAYGSTRAAMLLDEDPPDRDHHKVVTYTEPFAMLAADAVTAPDAASAREAAAFMGRPTDAVAVVTGSSRDLAELAALPPWPTPDTADELLLPGRLGFGDGVAVVARALAALAADAPGDPRAVPTVHAFGPDAPHPASGKPAVEFVRRRYLVHAGPGGPERLAFHWDSPQHAADPLGAPQAAGCAACLFPSPGRPPADDLLRAMARAMPVIVSDTANPDGLVRDGIDGFVAGAGDPASLAEAIRRLRALPPDARAAMGASGRARVLEKCDPAAAAAARIAHYGSVVAAFAVRAAAGQTPEAPPELPFPGVALADRPTRRAVPPPDGRGGRVSVVIPYFNMGAFLAEALDGLAAGQRLPDEVVVIDDGSTDPVSVEILSALVARTWPFPLRSVRIANAGLAGARRAGLAETTGDYVAFLDADDIYRPEYLRLAAAALDRHPTIGAVAAWHEYFEAGRGYWCAHVPHFPALLVENMAGASSLVRRQAAEELGGHHTEMAYNYEDWDFWTGLCGAGWGMLTIPRALVRYRVRADSMYKTLGIDQSLTMRARMMLRHADLFRRYGAETALMLEGGMGNSGRMLARSAAPPPEVMEELVHLRTRWAMLKQAPRNPLPLLKLAVRKIAKRLSG